MYLCMLNDKNDPGISIKNPYCIREIFRYEDRTDIKIESCMRVSNPP